MDMKRFFLYLIVIAALALAGCGSDGNGGMTAMPDPGTDPPASCPDGQTGTPPNCVTPTPPTCLEDPDAANCTGPTQAEIAAATKAARTKETAIATEYAQTSTTADTDAGLGGSATTATGNDEGAYNLAIKRDRDATMVTVTVEGATDAADEKFVQARDLGGGTTMHTRTMDADDDGNVVEEVVIVTTDIEAPKAVEFAKLEVVTVDGTTVTTNTPQALDINVTATGTTNTDAPLASRDTGSELTSTNPAEAAILAQIKSASFAAPVSGSVSTTHSFLPYAADADGDGPGSQPRMPAMVEGTYNGAMGTYTCSGSSTCTATVNAMGMLTALSDGWVFTPATGATSDQQDYDYLSYGFWLKKTTDSDGVITYNEVETFANSFLPPSGSVAAVRGTATYNGGATGVYVKNVTNTVGVIESATSGHFTATATLTATFGQVHQGDNPADDSQPGTIAPNMLNKLTGTIRGYQLSGGEENTWQTVLNGDITQADGTASGTAEGGKPGSANDGSFSATFHGSVVAVEDTVPKPSSVVGEFNSFFTDGSVAGAFGATRN